MYFGACYMCFKVRLWYNIAATNCSFYKGMGHIILDGVISNNSVFFPILAPRYNI